MSTRKDVATVTQASPLMVRTSAAVTPGPAKVANRHDGYTPMLGVKVIVELIDGTLYVWADA